MYWLRWHYHVKDIAGAPYKIKKKERKEKKNKTTESPTMNDDRTMIQLYTTVHLCCFQHLYLTQLERKHYYEKQ